VISDPIPTGNPHKGSVDLFSIVVGYKFNGRVFNNVHKPKSCDQNGKNEDKDGHPLPIVDKIEGCRV
jgi:hypothetical protein